MLITTLHRCWDVLKAPQDCFKQDSSWSDYKPSIDNEILTSSDFNFNGYALNVKCGQSHCKFRLTAYSFKNQTTSATPAVSSATPAVNAEYIQDGNNSTDTEQLLAD